MHYVLTGLGIGIGYVINAIDWEQTSLGKALGSQLRVVFLLNGTMCVLAMLATLCSINETPLRNLKTKKHVVDSTSVIAQPRAAYVKSNDNHNDKKTDNIYGTFIDDSIQDTEKQRSHSESVNSHTSRRSHAKSSSGSSCQLDGTDLEWDNSFDDRHFYENDLLTSKTTSLKIENRERPASALQLLYSIVKMPKELRRLCMNHFLSWVAMMPMYLFFTDYVGQAVYHGKQVPRWFQKITNY